MPSPRQVLIIGLEPDAVDFTDPDLPPGLDAGRVAAGLAAAKQGFADAGDHADLCLIRPDGTAEAAIVACLGRRSYDCVVVGAGLRVPRANLALFERVINAVHRHASGAAIAFNTHPEDSTEAASRVLGR